MLLALAACAKDEAPATPPAIPVRVHAVAPAPDGSGVRYSATVTPRAQVDVSFKVNGYIGEIRQVRGADGRLRDAQPGDVVTRGTVLAHVVDREYVDQVKKARANLDKAKASLEKGQEDFRRATNLFATASITAPDYDSAKWEFETAAAGVAGAKAQLDEAVMNLGFTKLTAPMDGVLLARKIEVGSLVGPGTVGFQMADLTSVKVVFSVPDVMLEHVKLGGRLDLTTESIPGKAFAGTVTGIAPVADSKTRVFSIEVTVSNPRGELRDGMVAALAVPTGAVAEPVASVPLASIVRPGADASGYAVYVVAEEGGAEVARLRKVDLGAVVGNQIAVNAGLARGERVIVGGTAVLRDGAAVRVVP
jgi:RND family efflux transporter MFP subunit